MIRPQHIIILVVSLALGYTGHALAEAKNKTSSLDAVLVQHAKKLFSTYKKKSWNYDPSMADLYAVDAKISSKRFYPNGKVQKINIEATRFKALIRQAMPLAKARGDRDRFSGCSFRPKGMRVWIKCKRYSMLKKYESPFRQLVGPSPSGKWMILEEHTETRP